MVKVAAWNISGEIEADVGSLSNIKSSISRVWRNNDKKDRDDRIQTKDNQL